MRIALIPPIPHLSDVQETGFHLVLSHLLRDEKYATFYRERRDRGDYLILDNGAHELGASRDHVELLKNAEMLGAQEIVLPDVLFDRRGTIERTKRMFKYLHTNEGWDKYEEAGRPNLMLVPQGTDRADWAVCFESLLALVDKYWMDEMGTLVLGISKDYDDMRGGLEFLIGHYVEPKMDSLDFYVHCLGWPRNLWSLATIAREFPYIRSTDSARPFVYAKHGILLEPGGEIPLYPKRDINYFSEELSQFQLKIAERNSLVFQAAANDELILRLR